MRCLYSLLLLGVTICVLIPPSVRAATHNRLEGVSLAGLEMPQGTFPPTAQEADYYAAAGMNILRLPFMWERLQPTLYGPLDKTYLGHILSFVKAANAAGVNVLIDCHNYAMYNGWQLGSPRLPAKALADMWQKLATATKDMNVSFDIMNEPYHQNGQQWRAVLDVVIPAIRATGATNTIFVEGVWWANAALWPERTGPYFTGINDNNYIFEAHQYFDSDGSGTHTDCTNGAAAIAKIQPFVTWLRQNKAHGFLGEFGLTADPGCTQTLATVLQYLQDNGDVIDGWAYWAAGPAWGNYMFSIEPHFNKTPAQEAVQMQTLKRFLPHG
ncbi:MAG TPA: glycoside hydrolase family 5 protein [Rickettsiales bacterium]|nr:glycoside hydrolase family 5 protein [Rickettsiales bacterium]